MVIGAVRSALARLLRSPGIETVYRLRSALPDRGSVIRALFGRYPALRSDEIDVLADIGYAAAEAAEKMSTMGSSEGFPLDDIPLNEHLGVDPDDMTRGRIAIEIDAPGLNFPREGGWQFYVDSPMDQTVGEFMQAVQTQARELIEQETAYHEDVTIPQDLVVGVTMKWQMRLY
jgi:hypothetical protein